MTRDRRRRLAGLGAAWALALGVLAGCSSGEDDPEPAAGESPSVTAGDPTGTPSPTSETSGSASASPTEEPYLPVPDGVELTAPGTTLEVGERAVVAWRPRQNVVGVLDIKVDRLVRTSLEKSFQGWQLNRELERATPYFVEATVRNVGRSNLGGRDVPLYIVDGRNRLVEASRFADRFAPCPSTPFPQSFAPGTKVKVCQVYLAPDRGRLTAVSFRPTQDFDPITWEGEVERLGGGKRRGGGG